MQTYVGKVHENFTNISNGIQTYNRNPSGVEISTILNPDTLVLWAQFNVYNMIEEFQRKQDNMIEEFSKRTRQYDIEEF